MMIAVDEAVRSMSDATCMGTADEGEGLDWVLYTLAITAVQASSNQLLRKSQHGPKTYRTLVNDPKHGIGGTYRLRYVPRRHGFSLGWVLPNPNLVREQRGEGLLTNENRKDGVFSRRMLCG